MENQQIDTYKIIRELGRGSMGFVYEAEDNRSHATVVLKLMPIPAGIGSDCVNQLIDQFKCEASVLLQLKHPGIAQPYDSGLFEGKLYAARELCQGTTLGEFLKFEKTLEHIKAKDIALKLLSALVAAHKQGIFHGDIKPENIMLARDGSVKLMDFGIARLESELGVSQSSHVGGHSGYMAPEQLSGKAFDQKSDLFSVGAVLYEALSGERVTAPVDPSAQSEPRFLSTLPGPWSGILRKALAVVPAKRYQTAAQMMDDVLVERAPVVIGTTLPQQPQQSQVPPPNDPPAAPQNPDFVSRNNPDEMPFWAFLFMDARWFRRRRYGYGFRIVSSLVGFIVFLIIVLNHPHNVNQGYYGNGNHNGFQIPLNYVVYRMAAPIVIAVLVGAVFLIVRRFMSRR